VTVTGIGGSALIAAMIVSEMVVPGGLISATPPVAAAMRVACPADPSCGWQNGK